MLKQARGKNEQMDGVAWLAGESLRKSLIVQERATVSPPFGLSFYAPDFSMHEQRPWLLGEETEFRSAPKLELPHLVSKAEPSSTDFARLFEDISLRIRDGEFKKVVPMVSADFEFSEPLTRMMFANQIMPGQFTYGFEFGPEGMAGVTPEVLFQASNGRLSTMALAGTGVVDGPSLLEDQKEMHEHRLVIDHIANELKEFGPAEIGPTSEKKYGMLKHLHTPMQFKLPEGTQFEELVARLHPTAALGGWPRKPAVDWLERQPFHLSRGRFGAPFGFKDGETMMCVVAIRNVQWNGKRLKVASGCGIVGESQVLKEWKELELKRQSIFRALGVDL